MVHIQTTTTADQQRSSSRLTLSLQRSFNQETLTCVAENTRMPSQQAQSNSLRQSIKLDVHCKYNNLFYSILYSSCEVKPTKIITY